MYEPLRFRLTPKTHHSLELDRYRFPAGTVRDLAKKLDGIVRLLDSGAIEYGDHAWLLDDTIDVVRNSLHYLDNVRDEHLAFVQTMTEKPLNDPAPDSAV